MTVTTHWSDIRLSAGDWAEAFEAPDPGTPHNEARDQIWEELLTILTDKHDGDAPADLLRKSLLQNRELHPALNRAWPLIEAADLVGDLWSVPAYLRLCAPWLSPDDVQQLQREDAQAWTVSDLPLLDAARRRLGDPEASRRKRRHDAAVAAEREQMARVVDDLIEAADDEYGVGLVTMLRGEDFQDALVNEAALPGTDPDRLAGPFAHIVVDEAQELTDAEWQMLLLRCPSRSFTIVGDRAQARHGFTESWQERLERIGLDRISLASLSINYRTPEEVMAEAEPVIRAVLPDANVPTSIRSSDVPVVHGSASDLGPVLDTWLAAHADGIACVIGDPTFRATSRVRSLTPELSKGLEFDLVVLIDPEAFGTGIEGAVDRYVAMTRATRQLVILTSSLSGPEVVVPDSLDAASVLPDALVDLGAPPTRHARRDRHTRRRSAAAARRRTHRRATAPASKIILLGVLRRHVPGLGQCQVGVAGIPERRGGLLQNGVKGRACTVRVQLDEHAREVAEAERDLFNRSRTALRGHLGQPERHGIPAKLVARSPPGLHDADRLLPPLGFPSGHVSIVVELYCAYKLKDAIDLSRSADESWNSGSLSISSPWPRRATSPGRPAAVTSASRRCPRRSVRWSANWVLSCSCARPAR
jgi:hypothetical protein